MTLFQAFYFTSYTASTIGFGEIPYAFTDRQRLWVTVIIYASVIGWAYCSRTCSRWDGTRPWAGRSRRSASRGACRRWSSLST